MPSKRAAQLIGLVALVAALLGLVEAQFHLLRDLFGGGPVLHRELATYFLGKYLAEKYPGKRAVILSNPFSQRSGQPAEVYRFERAGIRGLKRGLGIAVGIEVVAFPELRPGLLENPHAAAIDPHTTTPLSYMVADDSVDRIAREHPGAEILVSLIGLPANVLRSETWKPESGRRLALLLPDLRMLGDQDAIRQAFHSGKLAAAVFNKPGALPEDQLVGKDPAKEFEQGFLLVTPENVDQCLRAYPRLF